MTPRKSTLLEELDELYRQERQKPFWTPELIRIMIILCLLGSPFVAIMLYCLAY